MDLTEMQTRAGELVRDGALGYDQKVRQLAANERDLSSPAAEPEPEPEPADFDRTMALPAAGAWWPSIAADVFVVGELRRGKNFTAKEPAKDKS